MLKRAGFIAVHASNGREALEIAAAAGPIDLVLMDLNLGAGTDGVETARKILELREVPVVFLTAYSDAHTFTRIESIHSYGFVVKNNGDEVLVNAVRTALRLADGEAAARRTERDLRETAEALESSVYELKKSQEVAHVGNWVWHIPENRLEWSDEMYRIFGIDQSEFDGDLSQVIGRSIHPDDRAVVEASNRSVFDQGRPIPVEYRVVRPDGTVRSVWAEAGELEFDDAGTPALLRGIVLDIAERKRAEEQVSALVREKDVLLQEIHHRIKNSLATVESLLELHADRTEHPVAVHALKEASNQVSGMRMLYDHLLQSGSYSSLSSLTYVQEVCDALVSSLGAARRLTVETDVEDVELQTDVVFPLGAAITELVTNSIKYAYDPETSGTIRVSLHRTGDTMTATVTDAGKGFSQGEDHGAEPHSFGLMLVRLLAGQMHGTLSIDSTPGAGTEARITFPAPHEPVAAV